MTADFNVNGIIAGIVVLNISTLTIVASFIYLRATGGSNIFLIKEVMVMIFSFQIDRKVYSILQINIPWVGRYFIKLHPCKKDEINSQKNVKFCMKKLMK